MAIALDEVARRLNVPSDKLVRDSLAAYVAQQERLTRADVADLSERYGVTTARELRNRIESGTIHSHPAWEDAIEWETFEAYLLQLDGLRTQLSQDV